MFLNHKQDLKLELAVNLLLTKLTRLYTALKAIHVKFDTITILSKIAHKNS